jgi:hypothetical protein
MRENVDPEIRNQTTSMIAESRLMSVRSNVEKNKEKLISDQEILVNEIRYKAKLCKGGTKEQRMIKLKRLLPTMQRLKRSKSQMGVANQHLGVIDVQINAFENGWFQKEMTDTLKASVVALKQVGISGDPGTVEDMITELEELSHDQDEVNNTLSTTFVNSMDDTSNGDDALLRELMALVGDDDDIDPDSEPVTQTPKMVGRVSPVVVLPPAAISQMKPPVGAKHIAKSQVHMESVSEEDIQESRDTAAEDTSQEHQHGEREYEQYGGVGNNSSRLLMTEGMR